MHANFPLFPLQLVAHPFARISLQIFEPRYLDLVKHSLAAQQSFGIVTLDKHAQSPSRAPSESKRLPALLPIGTAVKIVDFDQLSNGLLGIVCHGQYRFRVHEHAFSERGLVVGTVETLAQEDPATLDSTYEELLSVALALLGHDYASSLGYDRTIDEHYLRANAGHLSWLLSSLLPVSDELKYNWLHIDDTSQRLASIKKTVDDMQSEN